MASSTHPAAKLKAMGNGGLFLGLLAAVVGIVIMFSGGEMGKAMSHSWLFAWGIFIALTMGCFGFMLLHHLVRGSWGQPVVRLFEAGGGAPALFAMALLFVPILVNMEPIYHHWMHPDPKYPPMTGFKEMWHQQGGFIGRTIFYFAIWIGIAALVRRSSLREDETKAIKERTFRTSMSAGGLVVFVITFAMLACTDWFMSIDPHWMSTMFGPLFMICGANMALALCALFVYQNRESEPYSSVFSPNLTKDIGNMLFAFTFLWIYFMLSQFIIIISGNLPEFTSFYFDRLRKSEFLRILGTVNIVFGWLVPWFAFLTPRVKGRPNKMFVLGCVAIIVMRFIDCYWNLMPFLREGSALANWIWTDALALLAIGGVWAGVFGRVAASAPLMPAYETRLQETMEHSHA